MPITRDDVLHVAKLARLHLEEQEILRMMEDLGHIVEYVELLEDLDTDRVPPTAHVAVEDAPLREDSVERSLDTETSLAEAPRASGDYFAVPSFVDEG